MKDIKIMFTNGTEILVNDVEDEEVRIVRIQKKKDKIKTIWIRAKNETINISKKEITLISYINNVDNVAKKGVVNSALYQ